MPETATITYSVPLTADLTNTESSVVSEVVAAQLPDLVVSVSASPTDVNGLFAVTGSCVMVGSSPSYSGLSMAFLVTDLQGSTTVGTKLVAAEALVAPATRQSSTAVTGTGVSADGESLQAIFDAMLPGATKPALADPGTFESNAGWTALTAALTGTATVRYLSRGYGPIAGTRAFASGKSQDAPTGDAKADLLAQLVAADRLTKTEVTASSIPVTLVTGDSFSVYVNYALSKDLNVSVGDGITGNSALSADLSLNFSTSYLVEYKLVVTA